MPSTPLTGIDPEIAKILGLDFSADFTAGEYATLLKEAMLRTHPDIGGDEELFKKLSLERDRVQKDGQTERTLKVKKKKISAEAFKKGSSVGGAQRVAADTTGASALTIRQDKSQNPNIDFDSSEEGGKNGGDNLTQFQGSIERIAGTVDSIHDTLIQQGKRDKKESTKDAKAAQDKKRGLREKILESKGFKTLAKGVSKVLAPVQSMFGKLINSIMSLITGKVILNIMEWWSNPENKDKADSMVRFIQDWWPVFAAGFLLFGTGLGGLVAGGVGIVTPLMAPLLGAIGALMLNPWVAGAVALGLGAWGIHALTSGKEGSEQPKRLKEKKGLNTQPEKGIQQGASEDKSNAAKTEKPEQKFAKGGLVQPLIKSREYSSGGTVSGPSGVDKVPARLTAGEFVMSKGAVDKWGVGTLASMNAAGGGTNRPSYGAYYGGGIVNNIKIGGYKGGGKVITGENDKEFNDIMNVQHFLLESSASISNMSRVIERAKESDAVTDIASASPIETPPPPQVPQQEVLVTPAVPSVDQGAAGSPESANNIPPFSALPGWNGMENKIKVLGFVR